VSRFLDSIQRAQWRRMKRLADDEGNRRLEVIDAQERAYSVVTLTSNKGGVGKTTVAVNLAVYLRALAESLPILVVGFDDQATIDRMFGVGDETPKNDVLSAMREGTFASAIRLGQYGVHYVPTSPKIAELKREIREVGRVQEVLDRSGWEGLVILDTKSDLEILTRNAIAASDLAVVLVADQGSFLEAEKVFDMLGEWDRPCERARILLSMIDLRIKYRDGESRDILSHLVSQIRAREYPLFETFLSRSPKVEALSTNPDGHISSILHGAPGSVVHRQLMAFARDVQSELGL
jgi:chromosome partitioning protein